MGLAHVLVQKAAADLFFVFGEGAEELAEELRDAGADAVALKSPAELPETAPGDRSRLKRVVAGWIFSDESADDAQSVHEIAEHAAEVILLSGARSRLAQRRPHLVATFRGLGFVPDYDADLTANDPAAVRLIHKSVVLPDALVPSVEAMVSQLNEKMQHLQRTLRTRMAELEAADRHIATLEEKLLKLKEYRRNIKKLKAEKQALRKSPERKVGQVLLAPYQLPQKLFREVRKRWPASRSRNGSVLSEYQEWFERHRALPADLAQMRAESREFVNRPCVSIITPVFNTPLDWLNEAVESVLAQAYEKWELTLIDDGSTCAELTSLLQKLPERDPRIVVIKAPQRAGISAASNRGLARAQGEWIGFLDHDDVLEPDALFQHVKLLQQHPDADLIYSDEDKLTPDGLGAPILKPDWSPDFFLSCNYICHFTMLRSALLNEIGGFHSEYDGAQDYDLFFRVIERTERIHHIPRVLYHWRLSDASTADNIRRKPGSLEIGRLAVEAHLKRTGATGHVAVDWRTHAYRIKRDIPHARKISIIIPVRDRIDLLKRCIDSLVTRTNYEPYEIIVIDNDSQSAEARDYFASFPHRLLRYEGPFNFSAMNNYAVQQSESQWLLFLNNDTEIIDGSWLQAMAEHVQRPEVGAVGARLLYSDDTIQHGGIVVGVGGIAEHAFRGLPADAPGVCRQLQVTRNYSAVTGACLLTRREVFDEVGGFDEERLPVTFNDVDLCLKMRRAGYLIVYTPFAKLYHHESGTRRPSVEARETHVMRERWPELLARDPYYNPNLSRERADFSLGRQP